MRPEELRLSGPARGGGGSAGIMIGSYFRKERIVRKERAGTMIGIHFLKKRMVKKKYFMLTRLFPEEFCLFMQYTRAVP